MKFRSVLNILLSFCMLASISGCGFSPLYGSYNAGVQDGGASPVESALRQTQIDIIPNREGQYLRNILIDHFYVDGYPQDPAYILSVAAVGEQEKELDITRTSDATRARLLLRTTLRLKDACTKETLLKREVTATTSYNLLSSEFSTRVSEEAARQNLLEDLARQIERQLALYFSGRTS